MPTTPTLNTERGGDGRPSSPHNLPPHRQLPRTARLPPPSRPNFQVDDDPFRNHGDSTATLPSHGPPSSNSHTRSRRRPQGPRAPPPYVEALPGLSSDDDSEDEARDTREELAHLLSQPNQGGAGFLERQEAARRLMIRPTVEESMLDPEDEEVDEELLEDGSRPAGAESDTADTEEAEAEGDTADEGAMDVDNEFDTSGLKEIGNLASWTVSTHKPGSGVEALRNDDINLFWQSDGPQPHHLNIHFSRLVSILSIRIYLDFDADESYTPTKLLLLAGTGYHDLLPFSQLHLPEPKGWIDVDLSNVGGGPDGNELRCFLVQLKVVENHQNGKDTHVRGLKIYARDEREGKKEGLGIGGRLSVGEGEGKRRVLERIRKEGEGGHLLEEPDWMGEPELR